MNLEVENDLWADAKRAALKVEFLTTKEELYLYANALYSAVMWGRRIDGKNRVIRERNKSVK